MNFKKYHVSKNLFDGDFLENGWNINENGVLVYDIRRIATTTPIDVNGLTSVTLAFKPSTIRFIYATFRNGVKVSRTAENVSGTTINVSDCDSLYICFYRSSETITKNDVSEIMLNTGSQPLPYEPYSSEVWHDIPHYIHNTSTDTITTLPAVIYANDNNATVGLKGDMEQSGTPSPTTPIQPSEVTVNYKGWHPVADVHKRNNGAWT